MRHLIETLEHRQAMFLLTLMTLEGDKDLELLRFLPQDDAARIQPIGQELSETPRKQLLPYLVKEIKRLISGANQSPLERMQPGWLAQYLKDEHPRIVRVLLHHLPRRQMEKVAQFLPPKLYSRLPQDQGSVNPEVWKIVRQHFEKRLPAPLEGGPAAFDLNALPHMRGEEIRAMVRSLGLRVLAIAFRGAGRGPLMELCRRLGPQEAENLLSVIRKLPPSESREVKSAQKTIRAISLKAHSKSDMIEEAGLNKLSSALSMLSPDDKQRVAYELPYTLGKRLMNAKDAELDHKEQVMLEREVLQVMHDLAKEGQLSPQWLELPFSLPELPEDSGASAAPDDESLGTENV